MPNRLLRDWCASEKMNCLSYQEEVFFIRLIMKADDFGRYMGNPRVLRSYLFPIRDGIKDSDIALWMKKLADIGLILVYTVDEKQFIEIQNFGQRLRQMNSRYPSPDEHCDGNCKSDDCQLSDNCQSDDGLKRSEEKGKEVEVEVEEKRKEKPPISPKGEPTVFPTCLDTEKFREHWGTWIEYRKKSKFKDLLPQSINLQLKGLALHGEEIALWAIDHSIANGYRGLLPEKYKPSNGNGKAYDKTKDVRFQSQHFTNERPDDGGEF